MRSLEVLGLIELRKGIKGGPFVIQVGLEKARDSFVNFLHFKNVSLGSLTEVRVLLEAYAAEKAATTISDNHLANLKTLIDQCDYVLKNDISVDHRYNEIKFHQIIGAASSNPVLALILDIVEDMLIDAKQILRPGKEFSKRVHNAHKRIYKALLERNPQKARLEMIDHVLEVEKDLTALSKSKNNLANGFRGKV